MSYTIWRPQSSHLNKRPGILVGVEPTHLKNMLVKWDHFPNFRGENRKYLKFHHLVLVFQAPFFRRELAVSFREVVFYFSAWPNSDGFKVLVTFLAVFCGWLHNFWYCKSTRRWDSHGNLKFPGNFTESKMMGGWESFYMPRLWGIQFSIYQLSGVWDKWAI